MQAKIIVDKEEIQKSIAQATCFMQEHQRPSGNFPSYLMPHPSTGLPPQYDSSPFTAALIAHCLGFVELRQAKEMIDRAIVYLQTQMSPAGVWRYFASDHPRHMELPFDLDDTATACSVMRDNAVALPQNRQLILQNRNKDGLFYTWLVPRPSLFFKRESFLFALKISTEHKQMRQFFAINETHPDAIDTVVNANVLYMLGKCPETEAIVRFLERIIRENREEESDNWHLSKFNLYYFLSKSVFAGFNSFASIRNIVIQKIEASYRSNGSIGENSLETALAVCTLINLSYESELIERAIQSLLANQLDTGAWEIAPFYYGGPSRGCSFGSQEMTTAFCLEALSRFNSKTGQ